MAIKTVVHWGTEHTDSDKALIRSEIRRLVSEGVTDGSFNIGAEYEVTRPWDTVEAAQSWIDFLNSLTPPPVSAEIIQDLVDQ